MAQTAEEGNESLRERVAKLEAIIPHLATKAWVLGGVIGGMGIAAMIALGVSRLFLGG